MHSKVAHNTKRTQNKSKNSPAGLSNRRVLDLSFFKSSISNANNTMPSFWYRISLNAQKVLPSKVLLRKEKEIIDIAWVISGNVMEHLTSSIKHMYLDNSVVYISQSQPRWYSPNQSLSSSSSSVSMPIITEERKKLWRVRHWSKRNASWLHSVLLMKMSLYSSYGMVDMINTQLKQTNKNTEIRALYLQECAQEELLCRPRRKLTNS